MSAVIILLSKRETKFQTEQQNSVGRIVGEQYYNSWKGNWPELAFLLLLPPFRGSRALHPSKSSDSGAYINILFIITPFIWDILTVIYSLSSAACYGNLLCVYCFLAIWVWTIILLLTRMRTQMPGRKRFANTLGELWIAIMRWAT